MELLEILKDDLERFKLVWRLVQYETVQQFRQKYPDFEYTQKSEEELIWEQLKLFQSQGQIPQDEKSLISDIIKFNIGEQVTNDELRDNMIFHEIIQSVSHDQNFNFDKHDGILSGGALSDQKQKVYPNLLKAIQKIGEKNPLAKMGGKNAQTFKVVTE